jgi:hypothetical protein
MKRLKGGGWRGYISPDHHSMIDLYSRKFIKNTLGGVFYA